MKRRTKIIIGLAALCAASLSFAACSVWSTPYDNLNKEDVSVRVRYDINGGQFVNLSNVNIVDVFSVEDALNGIKLIEPGSDKRGDEALNSSASRSGYFLAGWYSVREPRVDSNGNPLDDYGNLCSVSNNEQGYTYSGKWNFDSDVFKVTEGEYSTDDVTMTLYAAWVPNFTFTFYDKTSDNVWEQAATYSFNPTVQSINLELPYWADEAEGAVVEECSGAMTYGSFPTITNKTFNALYADEAMTKKITGSYITHTGTVDEATGTAINLNIDFYLDMLDGLWYHIYTADQFKNNSRAAGCYEILADLDFDGVVWNAGLAEGDFTGKIIGNNHTLSNITVTQSNYSQLRGGLFGRIASTAVFKDVKFENITYNLNAATRYNDGSFGLFTGYVDPNAMLQNVEVEGTLHIGNVYQPYDNYSVGLLCSNPTSENVTNGVTYRIDFVIDIVKSGTTESYPHKATLEADGTLKFSENENPEQDPN